MLVEIIEVTAADLRTELGKLAQSGYETAEALRDAITSRAVSPGSWTAWEVRSLPQLLEAGDVAS